MVKYLRTNDGVKLFEKNYNYRSKTQGDKKMNIGEYIKEKREKLGIGQRAFAKNAGMSHSYLSEIENGKAKSNPTDEVIRKIADNLELSENEIKDFMFAAAYDRTPEVVKEELKKTGMELLNLKKILSKEANIKEPKNFLIPSGVSPVYASVSAGTGKFMYGEEIDLVEVPEIIRSSGEIVYFKVSGDSMEPEIKNGSLVMVKEGVMPEQGKEGVFILEDEWFVKVFRKVGNHIILSSLNREYKDIEVNLESGAEFKCVGKVVGVFNFR